MRALGLIALMWVANVPASRSFAAEPPTRATYERAVALTAEGNRRFDSRDFEAALRAYDGAHALVPDPAHQYMAGRCLEELGRTQRAVERFRRFVADPVAPADRAADARQRIERLLQAWLATVTVINPAPTCQVHAGDLALGMGTRVVARVDPGSHRLVVRCTGRSDWTYDVTLGSGQQLALTAEPAWLPARLAVEVATPADAVVKIDGRVVREPASPLSLPPGPHVVRVEAAGHEAFEQELTLAPNESRILRPVLVAVPPEPPDRVALWSTFGAGAGLVLAGGALTVAAAVLGGELDDPGATTQSEGESKATRANGLLVAGTVSLGVGAALLGTSLGLWLSEPESGGAVVGVGGRF